MAHRSWYFGDSFDSSFDDEVRQALEEQPYFMLKCSKIQGAKFVKEISKKDLPNITTDGYIPTITVKAKIPTMILITERGKVNFNSNYKYKTVKMN